jgi:hypothetical protein
MHRGEEKCMSRVLEGKLKDRGHLEDPSQDRNMFVCILTFNPYPANMENRVSS